MNNRQKHKALLTDYFTKVQGCIDNGYKVTFDGDEVTAVRFENGVELEHEQYCCTGIYDNNDEYEDIADLKKSEIAERLESSVQVWIKADIKL